jgi:hypothetical protein
MSVDLTRKASQLIIYSVTSQLLLLSCLIFPAGFQFLICRKINAHLDKLEEQAIGSLGAEEAKIKSEIENLLERLNKKAVTIEMLQSKLSAVKLFIIWAAYLFPSLYL